VAADRGRSSEAEHQLPKLRTRVRFPSPALRKPRRSDAVSSRVSSSRRTAQLVVGQQTCHSVQHQGPRPQLPTQRTGSNSRQPALADVSEPAVGDALGRRADTLCGTWGTGLFQDDDACGARDEFRGLIGDGLTPEQASQQVLSSYPTPEEDPEIGSVVLIALALAEWKIGRRSFRSRPRQSSSQRHRTY
jgi:hypothetical protein